VAVQVLDVVMGYYDAKPAAAVEEATRSALLSWPQCIDNTGSDQKVCEHLLSPLLLTVICIEAGNHTSGLQGPAKAVLMPSRENHRGIATHSTYLGKIGV
jgi:hypothetical protein